MEIFAPTAVKHVLLRLTVELYEFGMIKVINYKK